MVKKLRLKNTINRRFLGKNDRIQPLNYADDKQLILRHQRPANRH